MIHASAVADPIVVPTLFGHAFSHSLDPNRTFADEPFQFGKSNAISRPAKLRPPHCGSEDYRTRRAFFGLHFATIFFTFATCAGVIRRSIISRFSRAFLSPEAAARLVHM